MEIKLNPDGTIKPQAVEDRSARSTDGTSQNPEVYLDGTTSSSSSIGNADIIKDTDAANFMVDVIEASMEVPVLVDFWAPWCGPCKQLGPMLEKLVRQTGGLLRMVKVNIDENQEIAAQLRVQSVPMVYAFKNGQPVDAFTGALPESQLKTFIDRLLGGAKPPLESALEEAQAMMDAGDLESAAEVFRQIHSEAPDNEVAIAGLIRAMLGNNDTEGIDRIIAELPADMASKNEVAAAISAFELSQQSKESGDAIELKAKLDSSPTNHQVWLDYAIALIGNDQHDEAIQELIKMIKTDRNWNEEAARKQLLKVFDALGPTHDLTISGRRALSSVLFS
ncbi:MAG: thioredoxin [Magnetovibrio sp.]|nr:thioredoxin [Magnetovibrio sp.]